MNKKELHRKWDRFLLQDIAKRSRKKNFIRTAKNNLLKCKPYYSDLRT